MLIVEEHPAISLHLSFFVVHAKFVFLLKRC